MSSMPVTPPRDPARRDGVRAAVAELAAHLGRENVFATPDELARYSRDLSPWTRECAAAVFPRDVEDVRTVLRVAASSRLPVWPYSTGKNWGYGSTVTLQDGAIVMILNRMTGITVNEELAYAELEPGVTYQQLAAHLKAHHPSLWADCTDSTPRGSVIGNALDCGIGFTPYGDHFGHLCGLEAVLPTGEVVRTGGGPANAATWHTYKWGTGPYLEGLFKQSNLGVVTKAGIWLMPAPEAFNTFVLKLDSSADVPDAVFDRVRGLLQKRVLQSTVRVLNDFPFLASLMTYPYDRLRAGETYLSDAALSALRERYRISRWTLTGAIYGTHNQLKETRRILRGELGGFGRLSFLDEKKVAAGLRFANWYKRTRATPVLSWAGRLVHKHLFGGTPIEVIEVLAKVFPHSRGEPSEFVVGRSAYFKVRGRAGPTADVDPVRDGDGGGLIWLAPVVPLSGEHIGRVLAMGKAEFQKAGFDFAVSCLVVNPRSVLARMAIYFDRDDPDETARARELFHSFTEKAMRAGYPEYRTNVANMGRLGAEPGYRHLVNAIKGCLDPDNILAPGRYGVGDADPRA